MTISPSPCCCFSRRALAFISSTEMPLLSSMKMGARDSCSQAWVSRGQSSARSLPRLRLCRLNEPLLPSMRITSCSRDISS